jgi:hypothetical protein
VAGLSLAMAGWDVRRTHRVGGKATEGCLGGAGRKTAGASALGAWVRGDGVAGNAAAGAGWSALGLAEFVVTDC